VYGDDHLPAIRVSQFLMTVLLTGQRESISLPNADDIRRAFFHVDASTYELRGKRPVKDLAPLPDLGACRYPAATPSPPFDLGKVRDAAEQFIEFLQQAQTIPANLCILGHHQHAIEETIHHGAQRGNLF